MYVLFYYNCILYTHTILYLYTYTRIYALTYPYHNSNLFSPLTHTQISSHFPTSAVTGLSLLAQLDKVEREQEKAGRADLQVTYIVYVYKM